MVRTYAYNSSVQSSITFNDNFHPSRSLHNLNYIGTTAIPSLVYTPADDVQLYNEAHLTNLHRSRSLQLKPPYVYSSNGFVVNQDKFTPLKINETYPTDIALQPNNVKHVSIDETKNTKSTLQQQKNPYPMTGAAQRMPTPDDSRRSSLNSNNSKPVYNEKNKKAVQESGFSPRRNGSTTPYWLRGNPQPKTGVRGSELYNRTVFDTKFNNNRSGSKDSAQQRYAQNNVRSSANKTYKSNVPAKNNLNSPDLRQNRSKMPENKDNGSEYHVVVRNTRSVSEYCLRSTGTQTSDIDEPKHQLFTKQEHMAVPVEVLNKLQAQNPPRRSDLYDDFSYDPWGKGGAGAPIRDKAGNLVADRGLLQQSWHRVLDSNMPHSLNSTLQFYSTADLTTDENTYSPPNRYGAHYNPIQTNPRFMSDQEAYRFELRKQIEDKRRFERQERELERHQDALEQAKFEQHLAKQRQEVQLEQAARQQKMESVRERFQTSQAFIEKKRRGFSGDARRRDGDVDEEHRLEWWEKQAPTYQEDKTTKKSVVKNPAAPGEAKQSGRSRQLPTTVRDQRNSEPHAAKPPAQPKKPVSRLSSAQSFADTSSDYSSSSLMSNPADKKAKATAPVVKNAK